ncbi:MmgE/PrpD family protein [Streptomyces brasiliensis]|uniref:2-methylcitrate dehydratase PrpD n=1 Tax=Streptomyces brasiliensis TaxID=1954 RepID=A0A917P133_9ACTN|nr:MmgE/PrpD family protein [Streptomyces brasiliensis]GGJ50057.1 hypothetical protein GCM10010121_071470 [Streptomyces brasiliensis]
MVTAERGAAPPVTGLTGRLGAFAARIQLPGAPEAVRQRLEALVADVIATGVSGLARPDVAKLHAAFAVGDGPSTVVGRRSGMPPASAAFLNAMPVAREQLQDGHRRARGHPASHVVPAVFAVAEAAGAGGPATLSAMLAGYETGVRIGLAMDGTPAGVHDIGTWATLGAAAGVAHLLTDGDPDAIAAAVELAAALPSVPDAWGVFDGWTSQHLYLASAAQAAVVHGQAAAAGARATPGTLERHFAKWVAADPAGFTDRLTSLLEPGTWMTLDGYLKRHPTCALLHGVNDAVEDLVGSGPFGPGDIGDVRVDTYRAAAAFAAPEPRNELAARFSIPWTVAAGLTLGTLRNGALEPDTLADTALRALASRVEVRHDPALDAGYPAGRPAVVTVELTDGTVLSTSVHGVPRGDGPDGLDDEVVTGKAAILLTAVVGEQRSRDVLAAVAGLGEQGPEPLGAILRGLEVG